jgi:ribonuclease J
MDTRREISRELQYETLEGIKIKDFRTGETINIDDIEINPIHVDHSIPGAYSFIIDTPEGNILYTGDYRTHGALPGERSLTYEMVEIAEEHDIDLMITEGTRFHDISMESEVDVYNSLKNMFTRFKRPILLELSHSDVDRWESLINAAKETGRKILIPDRYFTFLWNLTTKDKTIGEKINLDREMITILSYKGRASRWRKKYYEIWGGRGYKMIGELNEIEDEERYIYTGFTEYLQELLNLERIYEGIGIFSNSEPIDEEGMISQEKIYNWLSILNIPSYRVHCSGHIHPLDLKEIVDEIDPERLYVIHSEETEALISFLGYDPTTYKKIR